MILITDGKRYLAVPGLNRNDRILSAFNRDVERIEIEEIISFLNKYLIPFQEFSTVVVRNHGENNTI
jgi:hypothetical protein